MSIYGTKLPEHPSLSSVSVEGKWMFTSAGLQETVADLMMVSHPFLD